MQVFDMCMMVRSKWMFQMFSIEIEALLNYLYVAVKMKKIRRHWMKYGGIDVGDTSGRVQAKSIYVYIDRIRGKY